MNHWYQCLCLSIYNFWSSILESFFFYFTKIKLVCNFCRVFIFCFIRPFWSYWWYWSLILLFQTWYFVQSFWQFWPYWSLKFFYLILVIWILVAVLTILIFWSFESFRSFIIIIFNSVQFWYIFHFPVLPVSAKDKMFQNDSIFPVCYSWSNFLFC